jgi:hypothetical protein
MGDVVPVSETDFGSGANLSGQRQTVLREVQLSSRME